MFLLLIGCALVAVAMICVSVALYLETRPAPRFPEDRHLLPRMEGNYLCFPDWVMRSPDWLFRVAVWIGETFHDGRYCFTVDRNKDDREQRGDNWPLIR